MRRRTKTTHSPTRDVVAPNTRWIGKRFGPYRIRAVIDQDADSVTLLAEEHGDGPSRRVMLRRLDGRAEEDPDARRRFEREAQICLALRHANLVGGKSRPVIDGFAAIALEWDGGRRWSDILRVARNQGGRVPPAIAVLVASRVAAGLDHVHRLTDAKTGQVAGVVHGAVRPEVIHVADDGWVRLSGLGREPRPTTRGQLLQSMRCLAPEQASGDGAIAASDVYGLAVVLAESLTGRILFNATDPKELLADIVRGKRPPMSKWLGFRATALEEALERALSVRPDDRFPTAAAFTWALDRALAQLGELAEEKDLAEFVEGLRKATGDLMAPAGMSPPPSSTTAAAPIDPTPIPRPEAPSPVRTFAPPTDPLTPLAEAKTDGRPLTVTPVPVVAPPVVPRSKAAMPLDADTFGTEVRRRPVVRTPAATNPILAVADSALGPEAPASGLKGKVWTHTVEAAPPQRFAWRWFAASAVVAAIAAGCAIALVV